MLATLLVDLHAPDVSAKASFGDLHALGLYDRRRHGPLQDARKASVRADEGGVSL